MMSITSDIEDVVNLNCMNAPTECVCRARDYILMDAGKRYTFIYPHCEAHASRAVAPVL